MVPASFAVRSEVNEPVKVPFAPLLMVLGTMVMTLPLSEIEEPVIENWPVIGVACRATGAAKTARIAMEESSFSIGNLLIRILSQHLMCRGYRCDVEVISLCGYLGPIYVHFFAYKITPFVAISSRVSAAEGSSEINFPICK